VGGVDFQLGLTSAVHSGSAERVAPLALLRLLLWLEAAAARRGFALQGSAATLRDSNLSSHACHETISQSTACTCTWYTFDR